jgi:hypothetical protein
VGGAMGSAVGAAGGLGLGGGQMEVQDSEPDWGY